MSLPEHFLGEVVMFAGTYAPSGWAFCDGSTLEISQNQALFAVIGDTYGGDGRVSFRLPDLKDRFPVHRGNYFRQGVMGGTMTTQITLQNLPAHTHQLIASIEDGTTEAPTDNLLADGNSRYPTNLYNPLPADTSKITKMNESSISNTGGSQPITTVPPFTGMNFIICLDGLFPNRN